MSFAFGLGFPAYTSKARNPLAHQVTPPIAEMKRHGLQPRRAGAEVAEKGGNGGKATANDNDQGEIPGINAECGRQRYEP